MKVADLQLSQESYPHQLNARKDQNSSNQKVRAMVLHYRCSGNDLQYQKPSGDPTSSQHGKSTDASKKMERTRNVLEQETDRHQVKEHAEGPGDAVVTLPMQPCRITDRNLADCSSVPGCQC